MRTSIEVIERTSMCGYDCDCPHCGALLDVDWYAGEEEQGCWDVCCPCCHKPFAVSVEIKPVYDTMRR